MEHSFSEVSGISVTTAILPAVVYHTVITGFFLRIGISRLPLVWVMPACGSRKATESIARNATKTRQRITWDLRKLLSHWFMCFKI